MSVIDCPGCDLPHESIYSAAVHAWKSQGEPHAEYSNLDWAIQATVDSNDLQIDADDVSPDDSDLQSVTGERQADAPVTDSTVDDSPDPDATTDGGPRAPPSFATDGGDQDDDVDDDQDAGGPDPCPSCGDDGYPLDVLEGEVPDALLANLRAHGDRYCPDCSTSESAEVWES